MNRLQISGVMLDMARVTEKHSYYRALPRRLAGWGYNTIFAHFTDDEGCAMKFASRPELATPHAFSKDEMRSWVRLAGREGLTVIPEIEAFGHTSYIHGRRRYAALREPTGGHFNAINPLARETHAVFRDLVGETAEVFDAPFIHMGLDEVNFGASKQVLAALKTRAKWQIFAEHICRMHELVTRAGRRMMMWGDHLLHEPQIADAVPKDIVICDWHYDRFVSPATVAFFTRRGFEVVCCPASNRSTDMVMPNALTQINLQRFARIAHAGGRRVVGLMNTVWCPQRMLCGIEQFAMALAGAWFADPEADPRQVVADFAAGQFGVKRAAAAGGAILNLSAAMPDRRILRPMIDSDDAPAVPLTAIECDQAAELAAVAERQEQVFAAGRDSVKRNRPEYDNLLLAARLAGWSARLGLARSNGRPNRRTLKALLAEGRKLLARCIRDWNRGRHGDDPKRDLDGTPGRWSDALIPNLHLALSRLAKRLK